MIEPIRGAAGAEVPLEAPGVQPPPFDTLIIGSEQLPDYVGKPIFQSERIYDVNPVGVVTGLAWTSMGGAVLYIETQPRGLPPLKRDALTAANTADNGGASGSGSVHTTGQMGDVMRESTQIAHTFARGYMGQLESENRYLEETPLHLHVPEGATPKDG